MCIIASEGLSSPIASLSLQVTYRHDYDYVTYAWVSSMIALLSLQVTYRHDYDYVTYAWVSSMIALLSLQVTYRHDYDYVTYAWASSGGEDMGDGSRMYTVCFPESSLSSLPHDYYCLCYFSSKKACVVGYSDAFRVRYIINTLITRTFQNGNQPPSPFCFECLQHFSFL